MPRLDSKLSHSLGELVKEVDTGSTLATITATAATIRARGLLEVSSANVKESTVDAADIVGVNHKNEEVAISGKCEFDFNDVDVICGSPVATLDLLSSRADGYAGKTVASQVTMVNGVAGGNFANQPADDGVEVVSDNVNDDTTVTIWGTENGDASTLFSEIVTLNGTTFVPTVKVDWDNIVAVELGASQAGTITIREASGDAAITTITTGNTKAGISEITSDNGFGAIPRHDADGASVLTVALIGTAPDGSAHYSVDVLNGTTEEDHGTKRFGTITRCFLGAVASATAVTILSAIADTNVIGRSLATKTVAGAVLHAYIPMSLS